LTPIATTATPPVLRRIRAAVRAVLILGLVVSVLANVLHANGNWISQTIAAWPPLALLFTVELISRVPVYRRSLAAVRLAATATIAGIAAWVSYWHMAGVAARYGETGASPYLMPLTVDGLVIVASVSLVELAGRIRSAEQATIPVDTRSTVEPTTVVAPAIDRPVGEPTTLPIDPVDHFDRPALTGTDHPTDRVPDPAVDKTPTTATELGSQRATTVADDEPTTPVDRQPTTGPTAPGLRVVGATAAVTNAGLLRARYGDRLPDSMRQIRSDMGWSKERVDRAVDAYNAGLDQADEEDLEEATA
jgi:hypothetical protein